MKANLIPDCNFYRIVCTKGHYHPVYHIGKKCALIKKISKALIHDYSDCRIQLKEIISYNGWGYTSEIANNPYYHQDLIFKFNVTNSNFSDKIFEIRRYEKIVHRNWSRNLIKRAWKWWKTNV